ncbi:shikimate dehydrogenase [Riemerella anatipestifer]|nr:shikimate dehydrogenase [Riemerella anatipestifer]
MVIRNEFMGKRLGLIGRNISYSFSQKYFEAKFKKLFIKDISYHILDLPSIEGVAELWSNPRLVGFNVTIPYKVEIINYLDELSEEAQAIGAVNTVSIKDGKKIGYNTDAYGFERTLDLHLKTIHQKALVLGDGGAAKAVKFVLERKGIPYLVVSRRGTIKFEQLTREHLSEYQIIIQCTPVGTYPNVEDCVPFPFDGLSGEHLVLDLIYNPERTKLIKEAQKRGAKTANGLFMLEQQAEKAWEIWNLV